MATRTDAIVAEFVSRWSVADLEHGEDGLRELVEFLIVQGDIPPTMSIDDAVREVDAAMSGPC